MNSANRIDELSVGIKILDRDHREMSETIHELQADIAAGKEQTRTGLLLSKMAGLTLAHFTLEEGMMAATKFPGLAMHRRRHQRMMEEVRAFAARRNWDGSASNPNSLWFMTGWHSAHVGRDDLDFGLWLNGIDLDYPSNDNCAVTNSGDTGFGSDASS